MEMAFEEFEVAPPRTLSEAEERRLNRKYAAGDFGGGQWKTIESLVKKGFAAVDGNNINLTEAGSHYCFHHGPKMPL
jgi:hypothetical protein